MSVEKLEVEIVELREHDLTLRHGDYRRCRSCGAWALDPIAGAACPGCPGPPEPSPAVAAEECPSDCVCQQPDPDEVRRIMDALCRATTGGRGIAPNELDILLAAARAWLKLRERVKGLEQLAAKASRLNELIMDNLRAFPDARVGMSAIDIAYDFMLAHAMDPQQPAEPAPTMREPAAAQPSIAQVIEALRKLGLK